MSRLLADKIVELSLIFECNQYLVRLGPTKLVIKPSDWVKAKTTIDIFCTP